MKGFLNKVTVKIKKDKKYLEYIKIIRQYDESLSLMQIKNAIDNGDIVFSFNPENNPIIANGKDNSSYWLEDYFVKTLQKLKKAGANMIVMEGTIEHLEYSKVSTSKDNIDQLINRLLIAQDVDEVDSVIGRLKRIAHKNTEKRHTIIEALMKFSMETNMLAMSAFTIIDINEIVKENDIQYAPFYKSKIKSGNYSAAYYAIEGYAKIMQKNSYEYLIELLLNQQLNRECEALIVCELSKISKQPFNQGNSSELREWKKSDLKLDEIKAWKEAGYPDGIGSIC